MPKTKSQKKEIVKDLTDKINKSKVIVFIEHAGLGVKEMTDLRRKLKKENTEFKVVKASLLNQAFKTYKNKDFEKIEFLKASGTKAAAFGYGDEISPVKNIFIFSRFNKALKIKSGILEGKILSQQEVLSLALLPTKQELLGQVVRGIGAPVSRFVGVLSANLRNLICVLQAITRK